MIQILSCFISGNDAVIERRTHVLVAVLDIPLIIFCCCCHLSLFTKSKSSRSPLQECVIGVGGGVPINIS